MKRKWILLILITFWGRAIAVDAVISMPSASASLAISAYPTWSNVSIKWKEHMPSVALPEGEVHYGPTFLQNQVLENLKAYGPLHLNKTTVRGKVQAHGSLTAFDATMKSLEAYGPVTAKNVFFASIDAIGPVILDNVRVKNSLKIKGPLNARNTKIGHAEIIADEVILIDSEAQNIWIKKDKNKSKLFIQKLYLMGKTTISGPIIFESENGEVIIQGDSDVNINDVQGGKVYIAIPAPKLENIYTRNFNK
jgi:hypothetical protein